MGGPEIRDASQSRPDLLAKWWGPKGFKNTFHECDMRPGGTWKFTMHGPDGVDYPNHNVFVEFVPTERVVIDHLNVHEFRVTGTIEVFDGGTRVTFRQRFKKKEEFEKAKPICIEANEQQLDRLGKVLAEMAGSFVNFYIYPKDCYLSSDSKIVAVHDPCRDSNGDFCYAGSREVVWKAERAR